MDLAAFASTYKYTVGMFVATVTRCHENQDEFEDILDRKYEEGFIDALGHAFILLTGSAYEYAIDTSAFERGIRSDYQPFICPTCDQWQAYEQGSGDCKACATCCTCDAGEPYCTPY